MYSINYKHVTLYQHYPPPPNNTPLLNTVKPVYTEVLLDQLLCSE